MWVVDFEEVRQDGVIFFFLWCKLIVDVDGGWIGLKMDIDGC
jgi:hypothetical protein